MDWPDAVKILREEKECVIQHNITRCRTCATCDLQHTETDMIEVFQMAIFALEKLIEEEEE